MLVHLLLAVEPASAQRRFERLLGDREVVLRSASGRASLWERLTREDFDLVLVGRDVLPDDAGSLIASIRRLPERPEVIVLAADQDAGERAALLAAGCLAVLDPSLNDEALGGALGTMIDRQREEAITRLRADRPEEQYRLDDFVSDSPAMQVFLETARKVVRSDSSLLMLGETGVGKERLARAIHAEGPRNRGPFMAINCGALPESLLESELFGHEEGAFTGATRSRKGYFELAHRGTIFLDEIGDMPPHLQVKLLRALESRRILRVGAESAIEVDARVMAATNRDLDLEMGAGRFRPDLFYRLAVVTLTIPPLRERREDIVDLVSSYLEHFRVQTGHRIAGIEAEAMEVLRRYDWPGNVRELINAIERAVLLCSGSEIGIDDLPRRLTASVAGTPLAAPAGDSDGSPAAWLERPLAEVRKDVVAEFERRYLAALLEACDGRIGETARRAGMNERSLYDLMKRHGLRKESYRRTTRAHRR